MNYFTDFSNKTFDFSRTDGKRYLGSGGGGWKVAHVDLAALGVHHHRYSVALFFVQLPHPPDHLTMPLVGTVAHVNPSHVHPPYRERLQLLLPARRRTYGAHELRPPRAPEAILLHLRLRHGVHIDRPAAEDAVHGGGRDQSRRVHVLGVRQSGRDPSGLSPGPEGETGGGDAGAPQVSEQASSAPLSPSKRRRSKAAERLRHRPRRRRKPCRVVSDKAAAAAAAAGERLEKERERD